MDRATYSDRNLIKLCQEFENIIFYGLKAPGHSHRFIYISYMDALDRLGVPYNWVDDADGTHTFGPRDLVFAHGSTNNLDNVINGNPYLIDMHIINRPPDISTLSKETIERIVDHPKRLSDIEHTARDKDPSTGIQFDALTYYSSEKRYLAQPWGTDLHPDDFLPAALNFSLNDVFFIGTVWKSRWGNSEEIASLQAACTKLGLNLRKVTNARGPQNALLINQSRFAPTIAGRGQADAGYLACRFFKNISYGQYCFSNVPLASTILNDTLVQVEDMEKSILKILAINTKEFEEGVQFQQEKIRNYTIYHHLYLSIFGLIERI